MLKAVIFDMDGVLINSNKYIQWSFNQLLRNSGIKITDDRMKKLLGLAAKDILKVLEKDYGIRKWTPEEFSRKAAEIELKEVKDGYRNPEVVEFLKGLKKSGIKIAVATSSFVWRTEKVLGSVGIKKYFDVIITSEDVKKHKPNPDIFLESAKRLEEDPKNCVVFEDAVSGVKAAKSAGMKCVGMKTEYFTVEDLHEADLVIGKFSEVSMNELRKLCD